jgi:methyl-accepting chemotaxis protein
MKKLSLKMKLGVGFGTLLIITAAIGIISYNSMQRLAELAGWVDYRAQERFLTISIDSLINNQKSEYRNYLLSDNQEEMTRYAENSQKLEEDFNQLEAMLTTQEGKETVSRYRQLLGEYHVMVDRVVELHRAGKQKEALAVTSEPRSESMRAELGKTAVSFLEQVKKLKEAANAEEAATGKRTTLLVSILAILGIIVGLSVAVVIVRSITGSVGRMVDLIQEIAGNNLAIADMEITSQDEIGKAGIALNQMKNSLRTMIQSIAGTAEHVASASEEISSSATQQSQGAETQKDQTSQVATAMQEMSSTVLQVSENSNKAAEASRQAAETARHGGAIVEETLTKMRTIAESVGATAKKMEELGKSSDQIGRIIGVIDDIADQTNLLALNAAIEAARAGEQGRGFAVVADEVRKLAERTTTATKEIAQMIKNIQDETRVAVTAMEAGTKQVEDGVTSTAQAGDSLKEIIHTSEQVGEMITHIATAATEQSSASEEINNNMEQIAKLVKESAVGAQQSAKACQDLSGLALDLQKMVGNFNLDSNHGQGHPGHRPVRSTQSFAQDEPVPAKAFAASAH